MTARLPHPRLNQRVLGSLLVVALPLLLVAGFVGLGGGRSHLREAEGGRLGRMAEQTAATLDSYIYRRIIDVSLLAKIPTLREAATEASLPFDAAHVQRIEREWKGRRTDPAVLTALVNSRCSQFLADIVRDDPIYREIIVTDRRGRLVGASGLTSDYYQADEPWWIEAFGDGVNGRVQVGDVAWDESGRTHAIDITVPIRSTAGDGVAGVLKVVTDSREMFAMLAGIQPTQTGDVSLVRDDGTIVFRRGAFESDAKFFAASLLQQRVRLLQTDQPNRSTSFSARSRVGDEKYLVGVAPSQLVMSYPNVHWFVAVSEAESELFAPIRLVAYQFIVVLAVLAIAVLGIALWFSMRLSQPTFETDMHLVDHARIPHLEDEAEEDFNLPASAQA